MKKSLVWFMATILALLVATAGLQAASPSTEEEDYDACSPVDVVFLIDQSTSMSDGGNDPTDQRQFAVQSAITQMTDIALDNCPGLIHRVGVISYGSDVRIDLPLSEIGPFNPAEPDEAYRRREQLSARTTADTLGQTNPSSAFAAARTMLEAAGPIDDGDRTRKRAIIFITDGIPCVDNDLGTCGDNYPAGQYMVRLQGQINSDFSFDPVVLQREQCLQALRDIQPTPDSPLPFDDRQKCLTDFPATPQAYADSTFIWVLLMRDANRPYPLSVYRIWEDIVNNYGGRLIDLSNNRNAIPTAFRGILEQLTGIRAARLECGNFAVNPYLKKAVFNFNKFDPSVKVTLSYVDVNGEEHTLVDNVQDGGFQVTEHLVSGPNERYEIAYPYPGLWEISSEDCQNLDAFYQPIQAAPSVPLVPPVVPQYDLPPFYNPDAPMHLEFQFIDAETRRVVPEADHSQFALRVQAEVIGPDGQAEQYALVKVPNENLYRTAAPLPVNVDGNYTVRYRVASAWHDGEPNTVSTDYTQVFNGERILLEQTSGYQVRPVIPFRVNVLGPAEGETLVPIHVAPGPDTPPTLASIPVRMELINRDGTPFTDWAIALPRPDGTFEAEIIIDGEPVSVPLRADADAPGQFMGELPGGPMAGPQELTVQLVSFTDTNLLNEDYYPDNPRQVVRFIRQDETWRFRFITPQDGETQRPIHDTLWQGGIHWPLRVQPLPVRIELVDADGQPYNDPEAVMAYAPRVISATLDVNNQLSSVYLEPDPENPGQYDGEIISGGERGEQTVTAALDYGFPDYQPASEPARATFTRADSLFTSALTYYLLLLLVLLLMLFLIWRYWAGRNNPVRGRLVFTASGKELVGFELNNGKNRRTMSKKELEAYPTLALDALSVSTMPKSKTSPTQPGDGFGQFEGGAITNSRPVTVEYRTIGGRKQRTPIGPNTPIPIGDSFIMMEYQPLEPGPNGN